MAGNAYPHIIFVTDATTLPKERLGEVVVETLGRGEPSVGEINVVVDLDGYALTFWYDDGADGLAEHYADFLPETARRRRLLACTTMIDASGDADPDRGHAADLARVWDAVAQIEGVWVFSEAAKRFVGLDYGEGLPEQAAPAEAGPVPVPRAPAGGPAEAPSPPPVPEPQPVERPAAAAPPSTPAHGAEEAPERVPATPMPRVEPTAPPPAPMPTAEPAGEPVPMPTARPASTPVPDRQTEPAAEADTIPAAPEHEPEQERDDTERDDTERDDTERDKPGLFKRLFGRRK